MELYGIKDTWTPEYLLANPVGAKKAGYPIQPGNGKLAAGTILYKGSDGLLAPATTSQMSTSYALFILGEAVDTDADPVVAEDAVCYSAGEFVRGKIALKAGSTITAAYELILRLQGITLAPIAPDETGYDNAKAVITYKGNNDLDEDDYLAYAAKGSTHTVLANTVTKFTAPSSKSFSKWNTKADGSGTDYAAAASYTASADLTLYAVWA